MHAGQYLGFIEQVELKKAGSDGWLPTLIRIIPTRPDPYKGHAEVLRDDLLQSRFKVYTMMDDADGFGLHLLATPFQVPQPVATRGAVELEVLDFGFQHLSAGHTNVSGTIGSSVSYVQGLEFVESTEATRSTSDSLSVSVSAGFSVGGFGASAEVSVSRSTSRAYSEMQQHGTRSETHRGVNTSIEFTGHPDRDTTLVWVVLRESRAILLRLKGAGDQ